MMLSHYWNRDFAVLIDVSTDDAVRNPFDPHFAGTLSIFGHHHHMGTVSFLVPLSTALAALSNVGRLDAEAPITLRIVPLPAAETAAQIQSMEFELVSVVVEQH